MGIDKKLTATALVSLLLGLPGVATAQTSFTFTTIDVPLPPPPPNLISDDTEVNANTSNAIAGIYQDSGGAYHGFTLRGENLTTVDVPSSFNAFFTSINGINPLGQIAGSYQVMPSPGVVVSHAYFSPGQGSFTKLVPTGSVREQGGSINSKGETVGTYRTSDQKRHGFLWRNGSFIMTPFNVPNDDLVLGTVPMGLNDIGQIVGDYVNATDHARHGFLLSNGTYATLDPPGATITVAEGINNAGVIVGVYLDANGQHGFVFNQGVYTTIDVPGSAGTEINSINAQGQIVGYYNDQANNTHGFVGTPTE